MGPLWCTAIAAIFIMADLSRHVLQDAGVWPECARAPSEIWGPQCTWSSSQYHCTLAGDHCIPTAQENLLHLSMVGILFTIIFTWSGFILLMIGTMWMANIHEKVDDFKAKWAELRAQV
jgi:hypothetical protein